MELLMIKKIWAYLKKYPLTTNFILGLLLVLAFAPVNLWLLGILIPAALIGLWTTDGRVAAKKSLAQGFAFGFGFFGAGVSWVYVSIATYGNTNIFVASFVTAAFIIVLSIFPALQVYVYQRYFLKYPKLNALIILPAFWVFLDLIRGWIFTGFPWLYLGYTQTWSPLSGIAKLCGVYGVTWLCLFLASSLIIFIRYRTKALRLFLVIIAILLIVMSASLKHYRFTKPIGAPLKVLLVQGNISQQEKWDPNNAGKILLTYLKLTMPYFNTPLIIWPENAVTLPPQYVTPFLTKLEQKLAETKSAIVFGIPIENTLNQQVYNGALAMGDAKGMYLKRHLVPFGEYTPFESIVGSVFQFLHIPMSYFSKGPDQQYPVWIHGLPVSIFICYESAYPLEVRNHLNRAAYMITLTDDSWFGHSFASSQQQEIDAMRAIETERPILRATNNGITSIINSNGQIIAQAPAFEATVLQGTIQPVTGPTPWLEWGFLSFLVCLLLSWLCVVIYIKRTS